MRDSSRPEDRRENAHSRPAAGGVGNAGDSHRVRHGGFPWRSRLRRWCLRLSLVVVVPALLLLACELGLRAAGFGYPTDLFLKVKGQGTYGANLRFGWRFFPPPIARSPQVFSFPQVKPPGSRRIFVLGASAAFGYPDPAYSFARVLETMLRHDHPEATFEVINTAMVAINSHVVLPIAEECLRHEPDLLVVYLGNNEVIGPYGIGSEIMEPISSLELIRWRTWLRTTRIGQLLQQVTETVSGRRGKYTEWMGMGMLAENEVPATDPRLERVYDYFARNLADMRDRARAAGVPVIFCTVSTNLRDCAPFASRHREGLTAAEQRRWAEIYAAATQAQSAGEQDSAVALLDSAAAVDGDFAELHFRLGESLLALGRDARAQQEFTSARDLDALRFRADTRINEIIREVATGTGGTDVQLLDAERLMAADSLSVHHIPGGELFYEHVHLTFAGNYLLGRILHPLASKILFPGASPAASGGSLPLSLAACADRLIYTEWDQYKILGQIMTLVDHPPFTQQLNHAQQLAAIQDTMARLRERATRERQLATYQEYARAVRERPDDLLLKIHFSTLLRQLGDVPAAESVFNEVMSTQPPRK